MPGWLMPVVGERPWFLSRRASPQGCAGFPVASPGVNNIGQQDGDFSSFCDLTLEFDTITSSLFFWSHRSSTINVGGTNTKAGIAWGSPVTVPETGTTPTIRGLCPRHCGRRPHTCRDSQSPHGPLSEAGVHCSSQSLCPSPVLWPHGAELSSSVAASWPKWWCVRGGQWLHFESLIMRED